MLVKVFILGRPGSGKSATALYITKLAQQQGYSTIHISDYEILHEWFMSEKNIPYIEQRYFCPTKHDGFNVIDFSVLRKALEEVERIICEESLKKKLILIEFARSDYSEVLRTFSNEVLQDAYFLYLDSDINTCIERVYTRTISPTTKRTIHDHYVSEEIIKSYYQKDNKSYILSQLAKDYSLDNEKVKVIANTGSWEEFGEKLKLFFDLIFRPEDSSLREKVQVGSH